MIRKILRVFTYLALGLLIPAGSVLEVEDASTYGTTVNGQRIACKLLEVGDVIELGPYSFTVVESGPAGASATS